MLAYCGQSDASRSELVRAAALNPRDIFLRRTLDAQLAGAARLARRGDVEQAARQYEQVLVIDPANARAHYGLGFACEQRGRPGAALEDYRRAVAFEPRNVQYRLALAALACNRGLAPEGAAHYRAALALVPDSPAIRNNLAWLLASTVDDSVRDVEEGTVLAGEACRLTGFRDMYLVETLARIHLVAKRYDEALSAWRTALEQAEQVGDPARVEAVQRRLGDYETAVRRLQ